MSERPVQLETDRLILRPPNRSDIPKIVELAGDPDVARSVGRIPHPYEEQHARDYVARTQKSWQSGDDCAFAMVHKELGHMIGMAGVILPQEPYTGAEIGYWVGKPYWGQGYATEAARAIVRYAFEELVVKRVFANYFTTNPASRRVMEKAGLQYEGTLRGHIERFGEVYDLGYCGLMREEYLAS